MNAAEWTVEIAAAPESDAEDRFRRALTLAGAGAKPPEIMAVDPDFFEKLAARTTITVEPA